MHRRRLLWLACLAAACGPTTKDGDSGGGAMPFVPPAETGSDSNLEPGGMAAVIAGELNLRDGPGTSANILTTMPCGTIVPVLGGPSTTPVSGWWNVSYTDDSTSPPTTTDGWASGSYLIAASGYQPSLCGGGVDGGFLPDGMLSPTLQAAILGRAMEGVGYSYWWGHGAWLDDGTDPGSCSGDCPSCTHTGSYGADCSGYVAKAWQVPQSSPLAVDEHPYSTENFYNDTTYWTPIDRNGIQAADALVRWNGTDGHIVLFDSGSDPFGSIWVYEAYGCATGIIHDLRTLDSSYKAIRLTQ